ncbi:MAG: AbrB/MazE/SpoVT family DNA-binding domain-containing protein [Thermomicrobiales bacterium]
MHEMFSTVTSKGQVTIPKAVRERIGVGPHDKVSWVIEGNAVKVSRRESVVRRTAGMMKSPNGMSYATAEEMRAAAEEAIAEDAFRRMNT